jgi:hypothetical protein
MPWTEKQPENQVRRTDVSSGTHAFPVDVWLWIGMRLFQRAIFLKMIPAARSVLARFLEYVLVLPLSI